MNKELQTKKCYEGDKNVAEIEHVEGTCLYWVVKRWSQGDQLKADKESGMQRPRGRRSFKERTRCSVFLNWKACGLSRGLEGG